MTKIFKTSLFLLLALLLPVTAFSHDFEVDGIYYNINGNEATVTFRGSTINQYTNEYTGSVVIPTSVIYNGATYSVTRIGNSAFAGCTRMTNIEIPNSVISIGSSAFTGCSGLTSVSIPNSVISIGSSAFTDCSGLTSVSIPNSVTSIGKETFLLCSSLTSITIPNSVKSIGASAFEECSSLTSITIPSSVTSIGSDAFCWCIGLTKIVVESGNPMYDSRDDCNAIIKTSNNTLIAGCMNTIIPSSVTSIGVHAFYGCTGLTSIAIPNSVISIGNWAFGVCTGLESVNISNSVTTIGDCAFGICRSLTRVTIPNSVTSIGVGAFWACRGLTMIQVENGNPMYDSRNDCNAIIQTSNNTLIAGCMNTIIPNSVISIGERAFGSCEYMTNITIPNSVTYIGVGAFDDCPSLTRIFIPNSVTYIGKNAFNFCTGLTSVSIPNSVTYIGEGAFDNCPSLTCVTCFATTPPTLASSNVFYNSTYSNGTLKVPQSSRSAYQAVDYWKNFLNIQGLEDVFEVDGVYYYTPDFSSAFVISNPDEDYYQDDVIIPDSVSYQDFTFTVIGIDANAFDGCDELNSVVIGDAVETIGEEAFQGCTGLTSVTIGSGVTNIGERAFNYCNALQTVKCLGKVPPAMASSNCFSSAAYRNATLKVHRNYLETYTATDYWYKFEHIEGYGSAGLGDADGDGEINIADVTTLIDRLLNPNSDDEFYFESADLNYNGHLDIGDVVTLIDLLLTH